MGNVSTLREVIFQFFKARLPEFEPIWDQLADELTKEIDFKFRKGLNNADIEDPFYGVQEIAKLFGVKDYSARAWLRDGLIPNTHKPGGKAFRVRRSDVLNFAQEVYGDDSE